MESKPVIKEITSSEAALVPTSDTIERKSSLPDDISFKKLQEKIPWYFAPGFILIWLALFLAIVVPAFHRLPDALSLKDEPHNPGKFIAEYAQHILYKFDQIGPKVVGSFANENKTVQLLLDEIGKIRDAMNTDLFDMEVDRQQVSGAYIYSIMLNMYQGVQNIVVKLSTKSSTSDSYLLVNSHFDSKHATPSTGDDGFMVVVMLETLRQIATSKEPFEHPIIFLFNGAEENSLQASHGFITQHKWAKNCKTLINLDAAGSGGRDLLFQSGPKHNWLMSYYNKNSKHPFATSVGEEIFQSGILPSDTDFGIFSKYGNLIGIDIGQVQNGYVYHTKFDSYDVIPRNAIQSTGDNILSLVRAFSNAKELQDTDKYVGGHAVFYDFLGLFFIYYTTTTAEIINYVVSIASLVVIGISLKRLSSVSKITICETSLSFGLIFIIQLIGFLLGFGIPLLLAVILDAVNLPLTWFTNTWLNLGLYICPSLLGLSLPLVLFNTFSSNSKIGESHRLQIGLHAHCLILALLCIILTAVGIRSVYIIMISILFYTVSVIINLITTLYDRKYYWTILHTIFQIIPFIYSAYVIYTLLVILMPMMGRKGGDLNPDLLISALAALGAVLSMGFLIPLVNVFHRSKLILTGIAIIAVIFIIMSTTSVGFPYRPRTNVQRVNFLEVQRIFYEYNGTVSLNESGYLFDYQDRRKERPLIGTEVNLDGLRNTANDCEKHMMCGMPLFNYRWVKNKMHGGWLPRDTPIQFPGTPEAKLELLERVVINNGSSIRFEFKYSGPTHMSLFIQPLHGITLTDWSFISEGLEPNKLPIPYHIYHVCGNDVSPMNFYLTFESEFESFDRPLYELGVSSHYVNFDYKRDERSIEFIEDFPNFVHLMEWPTLYRRYIF